MKRGAAGSDDPALFVLDDKMPAKKRLSLVIFALVMVLLFLAACSRASENDKNADQASQSTPADASSAEDKTGSGSIQDVIVSDNLDNEENNTGGETESQPETAQEEYQLEYTLADLSDVLKRGMYFIVGNKAPAMDIITVSEIKSNVLNRGIETGDARLADEVADYATEDYIVIGSPCDNPVAAELLAAEIKKKGKCNIFEPGTAWIKLFKTSPDNIALYVGGGTAVDTRVAGRVLGNFDEHNLQGTTVEVSGSSTSPTLSLVIS